ncbi:MAG: hypothetical protein PHY54_14455 [Methylococcales bacterium]|nr:hypothetical protein [Methylococcales bacterium]
MDDKAAGLNQRLFYSYDRGGKLGSIQTKIAMKLILQIAVGVFLGTLASQFAIDGWRARQEGVAKEAAEKLRAEQEKTRLEQGQRIRSLLLQRRQGRIPEE